MSFRVRPWPRQWHTFWLSKPFGLDIADLDIAGNVRCFVMWRKGSFISSCDAIQRTSLLVENRNRSLRCFLQAKSISAEGRERLAMETIPRCDETIDLCALQNSVANFKHNQEQNATWDGMQAVTLDRSCELPPTFVDKQRWLCTCGCQSSTWTWTVGSIAWVGVAFDVFCVID